MCEDCTLYICTEACPHYAKPLNAPKGLIGICFQCDKRIFRKEAFQIKNGEILCGECASLAHLTLRFL